MKLNTTSYVHVTIRKLCQQLELLSGMKLVTDLSNEFEQINFIDEYGYIVLDFQKMTCFSLSHHLTDLELEVAQEILEYCDWLETGRIWNERLNKKERGFDYEQK